MMNRLTRSPLLLPLTEPVFRKIWAASLLSNFGLLIQGVGAGWAMTQLDVRPDKVALVQTMLTLPTMLLSLVAGALADMYDRRLLGLYALAISLAGASALSVTEFIGWLSPAVILVLCFVIGSGSALFGPAWQASVNEQVPAERLPAAVALNSISYNIARSFGPAIGGIVVAAAGSVAASVTNALCYVPLLAVFFRWQRARLPPRLPPERIERAIISGIRYILHAPQLRIVLTRTLLTGLAGGSISSLMPLVARDLVGGGARTYGLLLGAFGAGAVIGAVAVAQARSRFATENVVRACLLLLGAMMMAEGLSRTLWLTSAVLLVGGAAWMLALAQFNIAVQMSIPRWVAGRAVAAYQAAIAGGIAIGSWLWGQLANIGGTAEALLVSGLVMCIIAAAGIWLRIPHEMPVATASLDLPSEPEVTLAITGRSGPVIVEIEYTVDRRNARRFYGVMLEVQSTRKRNGAYGWSLARDVANPERWTERYHCSTWHDYLRQRERATEADRTLQRAAVQFQMDKVPVRVRRLLERPFGSVRWKDETPDKDRFKVVPTQSPGPTNSL